MTILRDILAELRKMFASDARLTLSVLLLVAVTDVLIRDAHLAPLVGGVILLSGSLGLLILGVLSDARRRRRP